MEPVNGQYQRRNDVRVSFAIILEYYALEILQILGE